MSIVARFVLSHKLLIVLFWMAVTAIGGISVSSAVNALSYQVTVPGREGFETNQAILRLYGGGGDVPPLVPVITLPSGSSVSRPGIMSRLAAVFGEIARAVPGSRIASYPSTHDRSLVSRDGRTTFALIYPPGRPGFATPGLAAIQRVLSHSSIRGVRFRLTGLGPLATGAGSGGVGVLGEVILGSVGALLVLIFVFRSALAVAPLLMAMVAIPTTFLLIWGLTAITEVSVFVEYLVGILGLGVGIDYSLLLVTRWREELARGSSNEEAVRRAMETAGVAIAFSGTAVAIGLIALVVLPLPFLRSLGYAGMLVPFVSVVVALTLLPVLLATLGERLDWPSRRRESSPASRFWTAWARGVVAHPWPAAIAASALLVALLAAAATVSMGSPEADSLATSGQARAGLLSLERSGVGAGVITPVEILVKGSHPVGLAARLSRVPGVTAAVTPAGPAWRRAGTAVVDVLPGPDGNGPAGRQVLDRVRAAAHSAGNVVGVGGGPAQTEDFVSATYGSFPLMLGLIALITFLVLIRAFRSIVLPLKAVLLNVLSVGAAWGIMVLVWQDGFGSRQLWGIPSTGASEAWVPLTVFAFLFGLSMDYEVFLLSRMREEYDASGSTEAAIIVGTGRTGRLVTSAALILFLGFVSLSSAPITDVKVLATGLGAGILLDATVVRMLLVPSLVRLFGKWNWWLPATWQAVRQ